MNYDIRDYLMDLTMQGLSHIYWQSYRWRMANCEYAAYMFVADVLREEHHRVLRTMIVGIPRVKAL